MKFKFHLYILFLTLGFLLAPSVSYACGTKSTKTEKSCCKKSDVAKECCGKDDSSSKDKGCEGKCGHSNCTTTPAQSTMNFVYPIEFTPIAIEITSKKLNFKYTNFNISSGYVTLWLIPKIS